MTSDLRRRPGAGRRRRSPAANTRCEQRAEPQLHPAGGCGTPRCRSRADGPCATGSSATTAARRRTRRSRRRAASPTSSLTTRGARPAIRWCGAPSTGRTPPTPWTAPPTRTRPARNPGPSRWCGTSSPSSAPTRHRRAPRRRPRGPRARECVPERLGAQRRMPGELPDGQLLAGRLPGRGQHHGRRCTAQLTPGTASPQGPDLTSGSPITHQSNPRHGPARRPHLRRGHAHRGQSMANRRLH